MCLSHELFPDALPRHNRFRRLFQAQDSLGDVINEILAIDTDKLQVREGEERDLSLLVVASLGKGMKTSQAVTRLCLLGYGEDALILIRSNINLLINIAYVLAENQTERVKDFLAFSYQERVKYLKLAHGVQEPPWQRGLHQSRLLKLSNEQKHGTTSPSHREQTWVFNGTTRKAIASIQAWNILMLGG